MKRKLISTILLLSILFSCFTIVSFAEGEEETSSGPVEDVFIMKESSAFSSASSSAGNRWNGNSPSPFSRTTVSNFMETGVAVSKLASTANFYSKKSIAYSKTATEAAIQMKALDSLVWSQDLFIPGEGDTLVASSKIHMKMFGQEVVSFTKQANGTFVVNIGGVAVGSVPAGQWVHFDVIYLPNEERTQAVYSINVQAKNLKNTEGDEVTSLKNPNLEKTISSADCSINGDAPADKDGVTQYGFYLNNTWIYQPGDFVTSSVSIPKYPEEKKNNIQLDGIATITLQHPVDAATFDGTILIYDHTGTNLTYKSISYDPGTPTKIYVDFAGNALPKFSTIFFMFPDSTKDTVGSSMNPTTIYLDTYGGFNEDYQKLPVVEYDPKTFIMPDPYNTGYRCDFDDLVPMEEKYPEIVPSSGNYTITDAIAKKYNYEFSGFKLTGQLFINTTKSVSLHDYYQNCTGLYSVYNQGKAMIHISHMEGIGSQAAFFSTTNIHVSYANVHDCFADILKGGSNVTFEFCYFHDAGTRNPGSHADGIQISGSAAGVTNNLKVIGCRFDMPGMAQEHLANCCFFFKAESGVAGFSNIQCIGNWLNGGGYTTYLLCENVGPENCPYVTYNDNKWGYTHSFGTMVVTGWKNTEDLANYGGSYLRNGHMENLQVGSILYYDGNKTKVVNDISEITSGSATVLLNFANYLLSEQNYEVQYEVLNPEGKVVVRSSVTGTISRNYCSKEYNHEGNWVDKVGPGAYGKDITYKGVKNMPFLPYNVPVEINLTNLPEDLTGYTMAVSVVDTTANKWVRSSTLTDEIEENAEQKLPDPADLTVTFQTEDGTLIQTVKVPYGTKATAPSAPAKVGYNFSGWSQSVDQVVEDMTVQATYTIQTFQVTFKGLNGKTIQTKTVEYGQNTAFPTPPTEEGHTFSSWEGSVENITSNRTITAKYTVNNYSVKLYSADGQTLLETKTLPYGSSIPTITVDVTAPDGYKMDGWSKDGQKQTGTVKGDLTLTIYFVPDYTLLNESLDHVQNAISYVDFYRAAREVREVLALWTEEEISNISVSGYAKYLEKVAEYDTIREDAVSDLAVAVEAQNRVITLVTAVASVFTPLSLAILIRRFF